MIKRCLITAVITVLSVSVILALCVFGIIYYQRMQKAAIDQEAINNIHHLTGRLTFTDRPFRQKEEAFEAITREDAYGTYLSRYVTIPAYINVLAELNGTSGVDSPCQTFAARAFMCRKAYVPEEERETHFLSDLRGGYLLHCLYSAYHFRIPSCVKIKFGDHPTVQVNLPDNEEIISIEKQIEVQRHKQGHYFIKYAGETVPASYELRHHLVWLLPADEIEKLPKEYFDQIAIMALPENFPSDWDEISKGWGMIHFEGYDSYCKEPFKTNQIPILYDTRHLLSD